MKEKITNSILNLFKVKSIVTFVICYIVIFLVINDKIEPTTTTSIIMLVFKELFDKNKVQKDEKDEEK